MLLDVTALHECAQEESVEYTADTDCGCGRQTWECAPAILAQHAFSLSLEMRVEAIEKYTQENFYGPVKISV